MSQRRVRVLVIDNYDSFTYNLVHLLDGIGCEVEVARNDTLTVDEVRRRAPDAVLIGPGPSRPEKAGIAVELVRRLGSETPILGVCLGHQAIGVAYGAAVRRDAPVHGKRWSVIHDEGGPFAGLPNPFPAARYHSLVIDRETLPPELAVTAWTDDGTIMAVAHRSDPVEGFQFHPESILTDDGAALVRGFLQRHVGALTRPLGSES